MNDNQDKINEFQEFFNREYRYLLGFSKSIDPRNDYEDLLHSSFIKARDRIAVNGYLGDDFLNYTRCIIMNSYKTAYKQNKKLQKVDIEDPNYYNSIENQLLETEEQRQQQKELDDRNTFLTTMIYEYIEEKYSQKEVFVFKTYYLLKHKHLNYTQLSDVTGYSITSVSNIIKKMKKDLRANLREYIFNGKKA